MRKFIPRERAPPAETVRRLVVVVAASSARRGILAALLCSRAALADEGRFSDRRILGEQDTGFRLESVRTRLTAYEQDGRGYQSKAGPNALGSERLTVFEPQLEVNAKQGEHFRHRLWVPVDIVTAASPNALDKTRVDTISTASRLNEAATLDWTTTYRFDGGEEAWGRAGTHIEEDFRSWHGGMGASLPIAEGAATLSWSLLTTLDWFDRFDIHGNRFGRANRSTSSGGFGYTQTLTPSTIMNINYGLTIQTGELGNTWNSVPLSNGDRGAEIVPHGRVRHAIVARASQFLPWEGALRLYYRFYGDDWGILAHSVEGRLLQRLSPFLYVGALARVHTQTGAQFFTTQANPTALILRTADSDLASLQTYSVGAKVVYELPVSLVGRHMHFALDYERYARSNDLRANVLSWETGYQF